MKLLDKEILFEDNHLLVIDKPAGLLSLPTDQEEDSALNRAKAYIKEKYHKPGNVFLHQAHRLDKSASGILVFAKTSKALSRLNEQIREGKWEKIYLLKCEGRLPAREGELVHYLNKEEFRTVISSPNEGKCARLTYRLRKDGLIEVQLYTGRYHQIRAQFAAIGCPIVGDEKYGAKKQTYAKAISLHHHKLSFPHPITGQLIVIESNNYRF